MKRLATLILLLTLLTPALAADTFDPRQASSMAADYSEFGNITVAPKGDTLPYLRLYLYSFPRESDTLQVSGLQTTPDASLSEKDGEKNYQFEWKNPRAGSYNYALSASIQSEQNFPKVYKKITFPYASPADIEEYTKPTAKTESDDQQIKETANSIISGETDAYKIAYKLADWVHGHVTYDTAYWQDVWPATDVLETGRGVCDEYSNLFIALARGVGLPARYVVGSVYTNLPDVNDFQYHAWAEVWFPDYGWIPFDPTFAEYGWTDPTHIKTRVSKIVEPTSISYAWQGGDVSASSLESKIKITQKENSLPNYIGADLWLQEENVGPGSYDVVWMRLENLQDFYVHTGAWLAKSPRIEGQNQQEILLAPGEKTTIGWVIKAPSDLDSKFTYVFAIGADALFSENNSVHLGVDPRSTKYVGLADAQRLIAESAAAKNSQGTPDISISFEYPAKSYVGLPTTITARIKNSGTAPDEKFTVCLNSNCKRLYVGINDLVEQNFTVIESAPGTYSYATRYDGQTKEIQLDFEQKTMFMILREFFARLFGLQ